MSEVECSVKVLRWEPTSRTRVWKREATTLRDRGRWSGQSGVSVVIDELGRDWEEEEEKRLEMREDRLRGEPVGSLERREVIRWVCVVGLDVGRSCRRAVSVLIWWLVSSERCIVASQVGWSVSAND